MILPEQEDSRGPLRIHSLHRLMGFMRPRLGEFLDGRKSIPPYVTVLRNPPPLKICVYVRYSEQIRNVYLQIRSPLEGKASLSKSIRVGTCRLQLCRSESPPIKSKPHPSSHIHVRIQMIIDWDKAGASIETSSKILSPNRKGNT